MDEIVCNSTTAAKLSLSISAYLLWTWQCSTNSLSLLKIYPEAGCPVFISGEAFLRRVLRPSSSDADEICFLGLSVFGLFWTLPIVVSFARYHLSKFLVFVWSSGFSLMSDGRPIAIILGADWWRFQHEIRFLNSSSMQCKGSKPFSSQCKLSR